MRYKAVIFDLDGTLLNTLDDLADSVNQVLETHGFPKRTTDEIRHFVGNGIFKLVKRALPECSDTDTVKSCFDEFCAVYKENMMNKTKPYNGIESLINNLKKSGFKLAVVTNKADFAAKALCNSLFADSFDLVIGSDGKRKNKPSPESTEYILNKLNLQKSEVLYVGDSDVDALTAENAGVDFTAVLWGFRDLADFKGYKYKNAVNTVNELEKAVFCSE